MAFSFTRFLDNTQRRTTVGRTPLDEWSAHRRDLYLTTHNTPNRQASMTPVGFEPTVSAGERPQTYKIPYKPKFEANFSLRLGHLKKNVKNLENTLNYKYSFRHTLKLTVVHISMYSTLRTEFSTTFKHIHFTLGVISLGKLLFTARYRLCWDLYIFVQSFQMGGGGGVSVYFCVFFVVCFFLFFFFFVLGWGGGGGGIRLIFGLIR